MAGTLVRKSLINAVAGVATTFAGFASSILVARLIGVEGSGIIGFAVWAATMSVMVADLGIPGSLARFLPELRARASLADADGLTRALLRPYLLVTLCVSGGFFAYAASLAAAQPDGIGWQIHQGSYRASPLFWLLVGLACLTQSLASFVTSYLRGVQDFAALARLALLAAGAQIAATTVGIVAFGVGGALAGAVIGSAVVMRQVLRLPREGSPVPPVLRARVVRYSVESWASHLVTAFLWSRMEVIFLERSFGSHAVGLFTVSLTLSNLAMQGPLLLTGALLSHLSQHSGAEHAETRLALYPASVRLLALFVFPLCLGTAGVMPLLLPLLFGDAFAPAVTAATILVGTASLITIATIAYSYLFAMERTSFILGSGLVGAVLAITAGLTVVPAAGLLGAASARAAIQLLVTGAIVWYARRSLGCVLPTLDLARMFLAALLCAIAARIVVTVTSGVPGLMLAVLTGALVYAAALRVLKPLPRADLQRVRDALRNLPVPLRSAALASLRVIAPA
ncbi:polysaccharide biosynthesis protein [Methylobacterium sp. 4-46]|uniref:lipopolysaccharide biosynthesis protein n=1 Tax=unclassified Methylobacterium TaxID=2615210 RepID=UPI000165C730|nr:MULTISPECIES: oligosaccharide flippase family protein [Methylobacterium]ACA15607.1 polysaccharide biosynthesis protein [Methylobacterium sp. 4-46]WFT81319.1 oligosaccharide flippase family protein [Methylobacterium nodulans]